MILGFHTHKFNKSVSEAVSSRGSTFNKLTIFAMTIVYSNTIIKLSREHNIRMIISQYAFMIAMFMELKTSNVNRIGTKILNKVVHLGCMSLYVGLIIIEYTILRADHTKRLVCLFGVVTTVIFLLIGQCVTYLNVVTGVSIKVIYMISVMSEVTGALSFSICNSLMDDVIKW